MIKIKTFVMLGAVIMLVIGTLGCLAIVGSFQLPGECVFILIPFYITMVAISYQIINNIKG